MLFSDFLPSVLPYVDGCPEPVALYHIVVAAQKFCSRTMCWTFQADPTLTVIGESSYPLELDDQQERVRLLKAWVNSEEVDALDPVTGRTQAKRNYCGPFVYMESALDLAVHPVPTVDGLEIVTQFAVRPSLAATEWPDELAEYVSDIADGAIASLCLIPRKEWTNQSLASIKNAEFNQRISVVSYNVSIGFCVAPKRSTVQWY